VRGGRSPTPSLESRKYFKVMAHRHTEVDPIGIFRNERQLSNSLGSCGTILLLVAPKIVSDVSFYFMAI
jgi:hypothetical protein